MSDTEHKEFIDRLAENTRQFLLSQLRAKIVDSSIDSSTALTMVHKINEYCDTRDYTWLYYPE